MFACRCVIIAFLDYFNRPTEHLQHNVIFALKLKIIIPYHFVYKAYFHIRNFHFCRKHALYSMKAVRKIR